MTSYQPSGLKLHHATLRWQISTPASWQPMETPGGIYPEMVPTLKVFSLRSSSRSVPDAILASGDAEAVVISPNGYVADTLNLPMAPQSPIIVVDFNGDGWNDLLVVTSIGIYAFLQV